MFKSIEYKLILYLFLLIACVIGTTYFIIHFNYVYAIVGVVGGIFCILNLKRHYKKFNTNIIILLNAIENGDYSFNFTTNVLSRREKELNIVMNQIKDILVKAKEEIITNEKFLSVIVENTPSGMIIIDKNNNIKQTNQTATDLLGLQVLTHLNQLASIDHNLPENLKNLEVNDTLQITLHNEMEELKISFKASIIQNGRDRYKVISLYNIQNELEANEIESWSKLIKVMTHEIMNSIAPITSLTDTLLFSYKNESYEEGEYANIKNDTIEALSIINNTTKGLSSFVESYQQFSAIPLPKISELKSTSYPYPIHRIENTDTKNYKTNLKEVLEKAKEEVISNEKFLSIVVENTPAGIIIINENNEIVQTNQTTLDLLGINNLTHIHQLATIRTSLPEELRSLGTNDTLQIKRQTDKEELKISFKASIIQNGQDKYKIISLYNINKELETNEIEAWNRLIRVMTHEIMNSIAPITSLTDTLLFSYKNDDDNNGNSESIKSDTIEALSIINSTTKGLKSFVESYREFSKIASLNIVDLAVAPFVQSVIKLEKTELEERKIHVTLDIDKDVEPHIQADINYLNQVLVNLIKNAIEAFDNVAENEKAIKIHIRKNKSKTEICIANNGPAIPPEILENIFVPFFTTKDQGSGIGLSLSRYILRRHGGNLKHNYKDGFTMFSVIL